MIFQLVLVERLVTQIAMTTHRADALVYGGTTFANALDLKHRYVTAIYASTSDGVQHTKLSHLFIRSPAFYQGPVIWE